MTNNNHVTRISMSSSLYDEVCLLCGASDAIGDNRLNYPCPVPDEDVDGLLKQWHEYCDRHGIKRYGRIKEPTK